MAAVLIQVIPPGQGGVSDYASCLQAQWERSGCSSHLLGLDQAGAQQRSLAQRIDSCRAGLAPGDTLHGVVLHYSGYGYHPRGLCGWLLSEVATLRALHPRLRLVVVYHELFATGPPWRSAFWLSRAQAAIAARLARQADAHWTNTEHHARWLRRVAAASVGLRTEPVFSNVGEPNHAAPPQTRQPRAIVFGAASTRRRALQGLRPFHATLRRLGVEELVEVGSGASVVSSTTSEPGGTPIAFRHAGQVDAAALRELLLASRFGVIDYGANWLGKSGVFAAYAAHGCAVLNTNRHGADADGLRRGIDYLDLHAEATAPTRGAPPPQHNVIASNLTRWYAGHTLPRQAQALWHLAAG